MKTPANDVRAAEKEIGEYSVTSVTLEGSSISMPRSSDDSAVGSFFFFFLTRAVLCAHVIRTFLKELTRLIMRRRSSKVPDLLSDSFWSEKPFL